MLMTALIYSLRTTGDQLGEAKASGNLGNTLKILGRFDEAVVCCQRHLDLAWEMGDKVSDSFNVHNRHYNNKV